MGIVHFWDQISQDELIIEAKLDPQGRAMAELLRRYEPLVIKIARSMTACRATRDDLANEARLAFFLAVRRHTVGQPGFSAYAELTMRGAAIRWIRAWSSRQADPLSDTQVLVAPVVPSTTWGDGDLADVVRTLPSRQRELVERRYIEDAELATIASILSVSESAISQQLRTIHRKLELKLAA